MADRIIAELKEAIEAAARAKPPQLTQPPIIIKDNTPELNRIIKEIEDLKKQGKSLEIVKKMLGEKLQVLDEILFVNIASIIIETNVVKAGPGESFAAVIMPETPCPECSETQINAVNLARIASEEDFNKLAQEQQYRIPYRLKGKIKKGNSGKWIILVSQRDYKRIFEIDRNGRLPRGTIIKSITDRTVLYPRILVKTGE
jgi:hypothetical protein